MSVEGLIKVLLENDNSLPAWRLIELLEASVHLPARGSIFIAAYRDETGRQVQRTTGERDRLAAQAIADEMEAEAKRKRLAHGPSPKKPTMRVRKGGPEHQAGLRTQAEVAAMLKIGERAVRELERSAFTKLRRHPMLREFWREWAGGGEIDEAVEQAPAQWDLSQAEIDALLGLAETPVELHALKKLIALTRT